MAIILIGWGAISLLLMAGAVWLYPSGFFDLPFSQMTFGIICKAALAIVAFVVGGGHILFVITVLIQGLKKPKPMSVQEKRKQLGYDK